MLTYQSVRNVLRLCLEELVIAHHCLKELQLHYDVTMVTDTTGHQLKAHTYTHTHTHTHRGE